MIRKIIKDFCPPVLMRLRGLVARKLSGTKPPYRRVVYHNSKDIPAIGDDVWNSPVWLAQVKRTLKSSSANNYKTHLHEDALISAFTLAAVLNPDGKLNVVDIGGGVGVYYPPLKRAVEKLGRDFSFDVFDSVANVAYGREVFEGNSQIAFHDSTESPLAFLGQLTLQSGVCVIVNLSSVLQYILEWRDFLSEIATKKPDVICISRLPVCDNATEDAFAVQDVSPGTYCGAVQVNLFSENSLVPFIEALGYGKIIEDYLAVGDTDYFWGQSSNSTYNQITLKCFVFARLR